MTEELQQKYDIFKELAQLFEENGYQFYLVGGAVRDFLLGVEPTDLDFVTTATPYQIVKLLNITEYQYSILGFIGCVYKDCQVDISTMRRDVGYSIPGCPDHIEFTKDIKEDALRRDFTINSIYMDRSGKIYDLYGGQADLASKTLRSNQDPDYSIKCDPMRLIRALRYHLKYGFTLDSKLKQAIKDNVGLLDDLYNLKVNRELNKLIAVDAEAAYKLLDLYNIKHEY